MRRACAPFLAVPLALLAACESPRPTEATAPEAVAARAPAIAAPITPTVVAGGLLYPRGLDFAPDGAIHVAEAGVPAGHTLSTVGLCQQVPAPLGPMLGGHTGRISRIHAGTRTTVAAGLPSSVNQFGDVVGVADLAFVGPKLYALVNGGCSRGMPDEPAAVARVEGGALVRLADLSAWVRANPTANPEPGDFEPDGDWYAMIAAGGVLHATEANQGSVARVKPNPGHVERLADVSATEGHIVPTGIAAHRGDLLVGELTPFPAVPGASELLRYRHNGTLEGALGGFTAVLGVDADHWGNVYVLESFTCPTAAPCFPSPGSGRVVRVAPDGARAVVAVGLSFATSLRLGPDGALYVSNFGYGPPASGQILRYALP